MAVGAETRVSPVLHGETVEERCSAVTSVFLRLYCCLCCFPCFVGLESARCAFRSMFAGASPSRPADRKSFRFLRLVVVLLFLFLFALAFVISATAQAHQREAAKDSVASASAAEGDDLPLYITLNHIIDVVGSSVAGYFILFDALWMATLEALVGMIFGYYALMESLCSRAMSLPPFLLVSMGVIALLMLTVALHYGTKMLRIVVPYAKARREHVHVV